MTITPSLGEIGCWALIFAGMAYFVALRLQALRRKANAVPAVTAKT
ncbi:MAG: hypothetical protein ACKOC9_03480 [Alphaproteobacteria bacterium]